MNIYSPSLKEDREHMIIYLFLTRILDLIQLSDEDIHVLWI